MVKWLGSYRREAPDDGDAATSARGPLRVVLWKCGGRGGGGGGSDGGRTQKVERPVVVKVNEFAENRFGAQAPWSPFFEFL
jgi:hypothetical protein